MEQKNADTIRTTSIEDQQKSTIHLAADVEELPVFPLYYVLPLHDCINKYNVVVFMLEISLKIFKGLYMEESE